MIKYCIFRRSYDTELSEEDPGSGSKSRKLSMGFGFFVKRRKASSTSCQSTEYESFEEDTASGSEGLINRGYKSRNQSSSSRGSRIRSFQHQSTSSCDSGVFGDYSKSYRLLLLGSSNVGKTSLIHQFIYKNFLTQYKPTLQEMYSCEIELGGWQITLNIEDTGQNYVQEFPAMADVSLRATDGVLLVYCVEDPQTFEEVS